MQLLFRPVRGGQFRPESIREVVFGVEDGVVQNMTLIAGMVGASLSATVIVLAGSINAIAGVLSMSVGTYLSSQAERDALIAGGADRNGNGLRSPVRDALIMAAAYALGAVVPLIPFMLTFLDKVPAFGAAAVVALAMLYWLGVVKAVVGNQPKMRSGIQLLLLATAAGVVGFLLGAAARAIFGIDV
ncbi:MAG: VIT1/CCC1 transporter family protein [Acidimicrobiia bacterium]|nr:VIT1/CCC1 transporter family protein [Acidimicrobiia bacterium]NNC75160.1 hypothetical protein [Acidimicrobiia bacterium]